MQFDEKGVGDDKPDKAEKKERKEFEHRSGFELWREQFTTVTALTLNKRTQGILADILQGMREARISDAAWTALQGRVLGNYTDASGKLQRRPAGVPDPRLGEEPVSSHAINYIVHRHQLRACQSFCNAVMHCQRQGQRLCMSVANDEIKEGGGGRAHR